MSALCLIPPLVVVVLGMFLRRAFEPLLIGCLVGFLLIDYTHFPNNFVEALTRTLQDKDMVWVILVCGLYGLLIHLLIQSGGVFAFGEWALARVRSRRNALLATWGMGLFVFIDDYMSALATGVTMRKITDRYRIPRETLAWVVNATAAPICLLVPMSTWSIYVGKLLEDNALVSTGGAFNGFVNLLPFMFYPWVIVSLALLTALGWFPMWGKLRRAETRVATGGPLVENAATGPAEDVPSDWSRARPLYFFLPLLVLIAATLWLDKDALLGVMAGLVFTFGLYWLLGVMRPAAAMDGIFEGFKSMIFALAILTMSYVLKKVGDEMGLTRYVIDSVSPWLSKAWLAPVVFLALAFISYTTASSWGMYAVAIPIVAPLAQATGANVWLALAAVVSAGAFGSQASFFSDVTVLTATSTECNNVELSTAQLPYSLLAVAVAAGLFLVCGWAI